jgi:hypothetical protein
MYFTSSKALIKTDALGYHQEILINTSDNSGKLILSDRDKTNRGTIIASGGAIIIKGEEGVQWVANKISDPNSPYKTEYLLSLKLDAAEELKKGNKAMKGLFGIDLDGLTGVLDPTNPQSNMAGASGSQTIMVRILSPYADE